MEVRDRDLGRGDQVQLVAGHDVHLVFLVRDLAGPARRVGVDHRRRPDLGHAVLPVWTSRNQLISRAGARTRRPCRPGSRSPAILAPRALSRMSSASPSSQWGFAPPGCAAGRGVGADLAGQWLLARQPLPQVRTVTLASSPPTGMSGSGGFGIRRRRSSSVAASLSASVASRLVIRTRPVVEGRAEPGDIPGHPARRRRGSPRPSREAAVAFGLERLDLGQQPAPLGVDLQGPVDQRLDPRPCRWHPGG